MKKNRRIPYNNPIRCTRFKRPAEHVCKNRKRLTKETTPRLKNNSKSL